MRFERLTSSASRKSNAIPVARPRDKTDAAAPSEGGLLHVYIYITAPFEAAFASEGAVTVDSVSVRPKNRGNSRSAG